MTATERQETITAALDSAADAVQLLIRGRLADFRETFGREPNPRERLAMMQALTAEVHGVLAS